MPVVHINHEYFFESSVLYSAIMIAHEHIPKHVKY